MFAIPPPVRKRISRILLDWAEPLPSFKNGILAQLQHDRTQQRKDAEEWQARTVPPSGTQFTYLQFRLVELCTAEQICSIKKKLAELIPPTFQGQEDELDFTAAPNFLGGGFRSLGSLRPRESQKKAIQTPGWADWPLPSQVHHVHLAAHQVLPTTFLLTTDVYLNDKAQQQLRSVQSGRYLPVKTYIGVQRTPFFFLPSATTSANSEERRAFTDWMDHCRAATERALSPLFAGEFPNHYYSERPCMPAIEVIGLDGVSTEDAEFSQWLNDGRLFLASIGENALAFSGYRSEDVVISMGRNDPTGPPIWRLYLLGNVTVRRMNTEPTRELCDELHTWIALLGAARRTDHALHLLQSDRAQSQRALGLRRHFAFYQQLVTTFAGLSRMLLDIGDLAILPRGDVLTTFKRIAPIPNQPARILGTDLPPFVQRYLESVAKYAKTELEAMRDEVAVRNMRLIYLLQIAVLFISIASAIFAYIAVRQTQVTTPLAPQELKVPSIPGHAK